MEPSISRRAANTIHLSNYGVKEWELYEMMVVELSARPFLGRIEDLSPYVLYWAIPTYLFEDYELKKLLFQNVCNDP